MKSSPFIFFALLADAGVPPPVTEHRFDAVRLWRFDYAWPAMRIAVEVEGAVWTKGRHTRGAGFLADCEKYNAAAIAGWIVLRVTPETLCAFSTIELVRAAGKARI